MIYALGTQRGPLSLNLRWYRLSQILAKFNKMEMQEAKIEDRIRLRIKVVSITLLSLELQFDMCVEIISLTTDVVEG